MKFEYVVSGLTMGIDDLYYNPVVAEPYIKHMNQKITDLDNRFDNQNLSLLYIVTKFLDIFIEFHRISL